MPDPTTRTSAVRWCAACKGTGENRGARCGICNGTGSVPSAQPASVLGEIAAVNVHNDRCASLLGQGCDCRDPFTALATCGCAVPQIKPAWDGHERLVCEDCHGRITRANKPLTTGQIGRPGELREVRVTVGDALAAHDLFSYVGDHGGGERYPNGDCPDQQEAPCPQCDANRLAAVFKRALDGDYDEDGSWLPL